MKKGNTDNLTNAVGIHFTALFSPGWPHSKIGPMQFAAGFFFVLKHLEITFRKNAAPAKEIVCIKI